MFTPRAGQFMALDPHGSLPYTKRAVRRGARCTVA
jgi:hypothetical protein